MAVDDDDYPGVPEASKVSRRTALSAFAVGVAGLTGGGIALSTRDKPSHPTSAAGTPAAPLTVDQWVTSRGSTYLIAHRGSGDVYPEHSFPAYDAALHWGAQAMEVSVQMTSDGVLICMHDTTYDRTTTISGTVSGQSSSVLATARLDAPWLGPAWTGPTLANLLTVPLLEDVLQRYGGRTILCLDAKQDSAFAPMMAMVAKYSLTKSVVAKVYATSGNLAKAQQMGYPVFGYWGTAVSTDQIDQLAAKLRKGTDYLVITPANASADGVASDTTAVQHAVATGQTTWIGPISRRHDVQRFFALGATGAVCSSFGYAAGSVAQATADAWTNRAVVPGEMTKSPGSSSYAPAWTGQDYLTLSVHNIQQFLTLGNLSPVSSSAQQVQVSVRWDALPSDKTTGMTLVFGHADDRYYEDGLGAGTGYHAVFRADGTLQIFSHTDGSTTAKAIGAAVSTPPPVVGAWVTLQLKVSGTTATWTRTDTGAAASGPVSNPGGYLHLGRSSKDTVASMSVRALSVS